MRLNRFATRFALALGIAALVLFAHERHHVQVLQILAYAGLLVWAVAETVHGYRTRHRASNTPGSPRP